MGSTADTDKMLVNTQQQPLVKEDYFPKEENDFNPADDKLVNYGDEEEGDFNDGRSDDSDFDRYMRLTVKDKVNQPMATIED